MTQNTIGSPRLALALTGLIFFSAACTTVETAKPVATPQALPVTPAPMSPTYDPAAAPDRVAILKTIDRFFEAFLDADEAALLAVTRPDAFILSTNPEAEGTPVRRSDFSRVIDDIRAGTFPRVEEPYWSPIVLQRKNLALVWAPYEAWINEKLSHCGVDLFTLTREGDGWLIESIQYTREPPACEELWPEGRSLLRPEMFSKGM